jgi:hypothetical protein
MRFLQFLVAVLIVSFGAEAADRVSGQSELLAMRVEVTWVESRAEIERLRRQYGAPRAGNLRNQLANGFNQPGGLAVLGKRNGEPVCLVFVQKPKIVDDLSTTSLGHELLHCVLGEYH